MPTLKRKLYGSEYDQGPSVGGDVLAVKRGLSKVEESFFPRPSGGFNPIYNKKTVEAVRVFQRLKGLHATGVFNQETLDELWCYMDAYARWKYRLFRPPIRLVEPRQGWKSLDRSLWEAYSIGRNMGMPDLGTYNPMSRLPSGARSDHAVYPAMAFDLGVSPANGYANPTGKAFFQRMVGREEVEYVILGNKIWSRTRGLHTYYGGGHDNHCHVSGIR